MPAAVIVTGGSSATRPAVDATKTVPIVMAQDNDPVGSGVVASLARPGGNVTGFSTLVPELSAKQLALLAEMVPGISRVAMFGDSGEAGNAQSVAEAQAAAARLNIQLQHLDYRKVGGPPQLFEAAARQRAEALLVLASAYLFSRHEEVTALALKYRLPAIYAHGEAVRFGGSRDLRRQRDRPVQSRRRLRRQDSQRDEAGRPSGRAADQVRARAST